MKYYVVIDGGAPSAGMHALIAVETFARPVTSGQPLPAHPMLACMEIDMGHSHLLRMSVVTKNGGREVRWIPYSHVLCIHEEYVERQDSCGFTPGTN
jgi:hypothetical protein